VSEISFNSPDIHYFKGSNQNFPIYVHPVLPLVHITKRTVTNSGMTSVIKNHMIGIDLTKYLYNQEVFTMTQVFQTVPTILTTIMALTL